MATTEELADAKIAAAEARTDTKIARMEGKIDLLVAKLDALGAQQSNSKNLLLTTILTVAAALAALIIGIATYGDALFSRGMQVRDVVHSVISKQAQQSHGGTKQ